MSVAVATLGCTRKRDDIYSWDALTKLQGDYTLYVNWELQFGSYTADMDYLQSVWAHLQALKVSGDRILDDDRIFIDTWQWRQIYGKPWRAAIKFDQDQARLASIVTARSMCIEYAMQTDADALLFIDADIIPPVDIIPKMLEILDAGEEAVCGLVNGRGAHSHAQYVFGSKGFETIAGVSCQRVEHANIGFTMLSRRLFNQIRFRYGRTEYPDGRAHMVSDDPAYHLDAFIKFGKWPVIRMDVIGSHLGDLNNDEVSQF